MLPATVPRPMLPPQGVRHRVQQPMPVQPALGDMQPEEVHLLELQPLALGDLQPREEQLEELNLDLLGDMQPEGQEIQLEKLDVKVGLGASPEHLVRF